MPPSLILSALVVPSLRFHRHITHTSPLYPPLPTHSFKNVGLMEFYNLTAKRHRMHVEGSCDIRDGKWRCYCDCTHFCFTPQVGSGRVGGWVWVLGVGGCLCCALRGFLGASLSLQGAFCGLNRSAECFML